MLMITYEITNDISLMHFETAKSQLMMTFLMFYNMLLYYSLIIVAFILPAK